MIVIILINILCFTIGFFGGCLVYILKHIERNYAGSIFIDPITGLMRINVRDNKILSNKKNKYVIFNVYHDSVIEDENDYTNNSHEKQAL